MKKLNMKKLNAHIWYFGTLAAIVLVLIGCNTVLKSDWFSDRVQSAGNAIKTGFNEQIVQPIDKAIVKPIENKLEQIPASLQTVANEVATADNSLKQIVNQLNDAIGKINITTSEARAIQSQFISNSAEAEKIWGASTPIISNALSQVRGIPQVASVNNAIKSSAQALEKVATISGSGLQKVQILTSQVRNALGQVAKVISIMGTISGVVNTAGTKISSAGAMANLAPVTQIGDSVTDIGTQINNVGDVVNKLSLTLGEALNILDDFSRQSQSTAFSVAKSSGSLAQAL